MHVEDKYEELRALIDGGSESMTHADAMEAVRIWKDAYAELAAVGQRVTCERCGGSGIEDYTYHSDDTGRSEYEPIMCDDCDGLGRVWLTTK